MRGWSHPELEPRGPGRRGLGTGPGPDLLTWRPPFLAAPGAHPPPPSTCLSSRPTSRAAPPWGPCLSQSWGRGAAVPRPCPRAGSMPSRCVHQAWREQRQWALSAAVPQGGASRSPAGVGGRAPGWEQLPPRPLPQAPAPAAFVHCRRLTDWAPSPPASPASYSLAVLCPGQRVLPGLYLGVPVQDWVARGPRGGVSWDAAPGLEGSVISGQGFLVHLGDTQCPDTSGC